MRGRDAPHTESPMRPQGFGSGTHPSTTLSTVGQHSIYQPLKHSLSTTRSSMACIVAHARALTFLDLNQISFMNVFQTCRHRLRSDGFLWASICNDRSRPLIPEYIPADVPRQILRLSKTSVLTADIQYRRLGFHELILPTLSCGSSNQRERHVAQGISTL